MARRPDRRRPSPEDIKRAADRAEGKPVDDTPAEDISTLEGVIKGARGRRSTYKDEYAKQAEKLCELGATDEDLAEFFNVSIRTIARWKSQHEAFCQALNASKASADDRVERSLYQRAVGYSYDAEKVFQFRGEPVRIPTREHCPPDVTAQIFWLKNRRPEQWRDKQHHELTGKGGGAIETAVRIVKVPAKETAAVAVKPLDERGDDPNS